jgi:mycoredoxin
MADVTVYGADWCGETIRTKSQLDSLGVNYDYIDVDANKEAETRVIRWNGGHKRKVPVVVLKHEDAESMVIAPSPTELKSELNRLGLTDAA